MLGSPRIWDSALKLSELRRPPFCKSLYITRVPSVHSPSSPENRQVFRVPTETAEDRAGLALVVCLAVGLCRLEICTASACVNFERFRRLVSVPESRTSLPSHSHNDMTPTIQY